jgi:hypothetical protein
VVVRNELFFDDGIDFAPKNGRILFVGGKFVRHRTRVIARAAAEPTLCIATIALTRGSNVGCNAILLANSTKAGKDEWKLRLEGFEPPTYGSVVP